MPPVVLQLYAVSMPAYSHVEGYAMPTSYHCELTLQKFASMQEIAGFNCSIGWHRPCDLPERNENVSGPRDVNYRVYVRAAIVLAMMVGDCAQGLGKI